MKKLTVFLIIITVAIYLVWPSAPKEGFAKFKEETNKEFNEFKSKN